MQHVSFRTVGQPERDSATLDETFLGGKIAETMSFSVSTHQTLFALPTETKVENGTSQSKRGISINSSDGGIFAKGFL